jgi:V/A-type H+-transporting ATPase subunit D
MVIHPTRTNLLLYKEKLRSVTNSIDILRARRKSLIREFIRTTMPFLKTREEIRKTYGKAVNELAMSMGHEGKDFIESLGSVMESDVMVEVIEKNLWGLIYKDIAFNRDPVRAPDKRGYDFIPTTAHLEEGIYLFERVVEFMLQLASYENKLKRLGDEIVRLTRNIKVLEERVIPDLNVRIKTIADHIGERERETYFRLKRFKSLLVGAVAQQEI